jgi:hypothetical protein
MQSFFMPQEDKQKRKAVLTIMLLILLVRKKYAGLPNAR